MRRIHDLIAELKRRHVYRVTAMYIFVGWVIIEAASVVVPELQLPSWITRAVIVVTLLGLPLVIVLAWAYDVTPQGVQRTDASARHATDATPAPAPAPAPRRPAVIAALVLVVLIAGGIGAYAFSTRGPDTLTGTALVDELIALSGAGDYVAAFELAQRAAGDGEVLEDSVTVLFTDRLTVLSDVPGARVSVLRYRAGALPGDTAWLELGSTPLRGVPIARGDHRVRIEADGHAPVERIVSSALSRSMQRTVAGSEVQSEVSMLPSDRVPEGMVHVPGGRYQIASRDLQSLSASLADFFIDRFEVSNSRFAEFVDAGGYARPEYWTELAEAASADAAVASAAAVRQTLVDRTGLAGPRGWSGQQHPQGAGLDPVSGVSWYEAAAYCRFRGARLPTLFEWEKTARDGVTAFNAGVMLPWGYVGPGEATEERANFNGTAVDPVGSHPFGISAYGAHDMGGNVKEWLSNRSEAGRAVTGGSWADPLYVFSEVGSLDPTASPATVGFRCARTAEPGPTAAGAQGDGAIRLVVQTPVYQPVDATAFARLLAHYQYDPRPLDAVVEDRVETSAWVRERIRYNGPGGTRVVAYLFLPKSGAPPYQTMVYVPNSGVFYGENVASQAEDMLGPLVRAGRALFAVVMEGMTEREQPEGYEPPATNSVAFRDEMVRRATELRLGLDYLETREELDRDGIAYIASSWGAGSRLVFAAVDDRFRAVVLIGAGIDERAHPTLPEASNINFAPHISAPTLIVNGREDEEHPWLTRALPLWNLLQEPKELALFDGVGHVPPPEMRIPRIRQFLDDHLTRR